MLQECNNERIGAACTLMRPRAIDRETVMPTYMYDAAGYRGTARTAERQELGLG